MCQLQTFWAENSDQHTHSTCVSKYISYNLLFPYSYQEYSNMSHNKAFRRFHLWFLYEYTCKLSACLHLVVAKCDFDSILVLILRSFVCLFFFFLQKFGFDLHIFSLHVFQSFKYFRMKSKSSTFICCPGENITYTHSIFHTK